MNWRRHCTIFLFLLCVLSPATASFAISQDGRVAGDESVQPMQDAAPQAQTPKTPDIPKDVAKAIGEEHAWSLLSYAPTTALLREMAAARADRSINLPYEVLKLSARSIGAASAKLSSLAPAMEPFRGRNNAYAFSRPRDWRENKAGASALREEELLAGEMFVSPESGAFLSSGYRRLAASAPRESIAPEALIDRLLWKLRRLPGVDDARETARKVSYEKGMLRAQIGLEVSFRPSLNDPPISFLGRAVILRNSEGVFELIGLRQSMSPANIARLIDRALDSATLRTNLQ